MTCFAAQLPFPDGWGMSFPGRLPPISNSASMMFSVSRERQLRPASDIRRVSGGEAGSFQFPGRNYPTYPTTRRFPMHPNGLRALGRRRVRRVRQVFRGFLSPWPPESP